MRFTLAFAFAFGITLSLLVPIGAKEPEKVLRKSLEVVSSREKRTVDFGEDGSLVLLCGRPDGPHLAPFRIDVGAELRVFQAEAWKTLPDEGFQKALDVYCMASSGVGSAPFIQLEVDESSDAKLLSEVCVRLLKLHHRLPQMKSIKTVYLAKRTAQDKPRDPERPAGK